MIRVICTCLLLLFVGAPAFADNDFDTKAYKRKSKAEKEAEIEEAEAEAAANKEQFARVIVLRWQGTTTDQRDVNLQRNVRSAIGKTDALFLPAIDLYQDGREIKSQTLAPELQPSTVSSDDIDQVLQTYSRAKRIQYDDVDVNEWQSLGLKYRKVAERIWFVDRPELREPLFLLYTQIGRTADYLSDSPPPLFEYVGGRNVNYYYYLAASMAYQQPELLAQVVDPDVQGGIQYYVDLLQRGVFPSMKMDFQMEDKFDLEEFTDEYEVLINGLPVEVDTNGELDVFLGRSDILLKRKDEGMGLSDRYEAVKTEDKAHRILELARKRMEVDFIRQLFLYENECKPEVDSDILTYLSIYAKLHPEVSRQIYIAVPKAGNPNKVWVWRFDPSTTSLNLVESGNEEFPVHFIASMGMGGLYNGATISVEPPTPDQVANGTNVGSLVNANLISLNVPVAFDFRAHYTRFMIQIGVEYGLSLNDEGWTEYYQTPGLKFNDGVENRDEFYSVATVQVDENCLKEGPNKRRIGDVSDCTIVQEAYQQSRFSRHRYVGVGYLFGRDASFGYGWRTAVRVGVLNMPSSWLTTVHAGYTYPMDFFDIGKRIRPVVDADIRLGTASARERSLAYDLGQIDLIEPVFGFTLTAGTTF